MKEGLALLGFVLGSDIRDPPVAECALSVNIMYRHKRITLSAA